MASTSKPTVIGVDVGAANTVVAYIAKGVDIVLDQSSKRKTPSCVVFGNENRLLGTEGDSVIKSNLKNSATNFRSLIGLKFGTETHKAEKPFALGQLVETEKGNVGFKINYCKDVSVIREKAIKAYYSSFQKKIRVIWLIYLW